MPFGLFLCVPAKENKFSGKEYIIFSSKMELNIKYEKCRRNLFRPEEL